MDLNCYNSRLEIDLDTIGRNVEKIRAYTGTQVLPVVKSNAYGLGAVPIANYLVRSCGVRFLATARLYEACEILDSGCTGSEILILGPVPEYSIPVAAERGIQIPLFLERDARLLSRQAKALGRPYLKAHLKIETGMNRIGVRPGQELEEYLKLIKGLGNLVIEGVYTHFSTADQANQGAGNDFTREQFSRFLQALDQIRAAGITPASSTAATPESPPG